jgi:transposase
MGKHIGRFRHQGGVVQARRMRDGNSKTVASKQFSELLQKLNEEM